MASTKVKMERYRARQAAGVTAERNTCSTCLAEKPSSEFRNDWHRPTGLSGQCRGCVANRDRMKRFDLDAEGYIALLEEQGHVCAICLNPEGAIDPRNGRLKALAVDHDHSTGTVRGLLCGNCNKGIGNLGDNPERLIAAAAYLMQRSEGVI